MKRKRVSFIQCYLIYVAVLAVLVTASALYVRSLLRDYEASQPERVVDEAVAALRESAADGTFWSRYGAPDAAAGALESGVDLKAAYLGLYAGELSCKKTGGEQDTLAYRVENDGFPLAEIDLRAEGEAVTRLAIFTSRDWAVESVSPLFAPRDYTLSVPEGFSVTVNGRALAESDAAREQNGVTYTLAGLYLRPELTITDPKGRNVAYRLQNERVVPEIYHYVLTLPDVLRVTVNGAPDAGESAGDGLLRHEILELSRPEVTVSDHYGNTVSYEGGALPLTYAAVKVRSGDTVRVAEREVAAEDVEISDDPEYAAFAELLPDLPKVALCRVAILTDDAPISVTDARGNVTALTSGESAYDLTEPERLPAVPDEVAAQIDVIDVGHKWSLFLTRDLPFSGISPYLVKDSYQYTTARQYATGIDITFTSKHTLKSPPFTEDSATNFTWITDDCFSVDVHFVKHMHLATGRDHDDTMNDRFYFVRHANGAASDPAWKLAGMTEIVENAGN